MTNPAHGNVVSLSLSQGESPNPTATFTGAMAARQVILGSGPAAHWKVRGHGVEAAHLELYWDGKVLWVRDGGSLSGVYVGVDRADDWQQIFDGAEVYFGQAVIRAVVTGPDAREKNVTGPINPKAAAFIDEEESTMVFSGEGFAALRASNAPPPMVNHAPAPQRQTHPATGQLPSLPGAQAQAPARTSNPAPAQRQRGFTPDPGLAPASSEATVIRASPYAAMEAAGLLNNSHPHHQHQPQNSAPLTPLAGMSPARMSAPAPMVQRPSVNLPAAQPVAAMAPPPQPASGFVPGAFGPLLGPTSAPPMMNASTSIAPGFDDPFGPMEMPPAPPPNKDAGTPGPAGVPMRTWLLAALTLGVAALGMTFNNAPHAAGGAGGAQRRAVRQIVRTTAAPAPTSNNLLGLPTGPNQLLGVIVPAPIVATPNGNGPPRFPPPNAADPIKAAADMVAAHRYAEAAAMYEALAAQHREAPLFRHFALVLRARAAQPSCAPGAAGCTPSPAAPASP